MRFKDFINEAIYITCHTTENGQHVWVTNNGKMEKIDLIDRDVFNRIKPYENKDGSYEPKVLQLLQRFKKPEPKPEPKADNQLELF